MEHWDAIDFGEAADRLGEAITNLLEQRGRGDRVAKVLGQEGNYLATSSEPDYPAYARDLGGLRRVYGRASLKLDLKNVG